MNVIKPGLDRTCAAWKLLGNPGKSTPTVLVAGTNGKGSTSGFIWHLLCIFGKRAGYFSSPHLMEFRERIAVNEVEITNELLGQTLKSMRSVLPQDLWDEMSFFEINTLLALKIFELLECEVNVLEVGLGGRLDCTNIIDPTVSVITNIGLDHVEFLGSNTSKIASEKAGIIRPLGICVWGGTHSSDIESDKVIRNQCKLLNSKLTVFGSDLGFENADLNSPSNHVVFNKESIKVPKVFFKWPSYLKENFALAVAATIQLLDKAESTTDVSKFINEIPEKFGTSKYPWPVTLKGRFSHANVCKDGQSYKVLLDVCHNPHGARAFSKGLKETGLCEQKSRRPAFISILKDKDAAGIWEELKGRISDVILFQIPSDRTWANDQDIIPGEMKESFYAAWQSAITSPRWVQDNQKPWLIIGSVAGIGQAMSELIINGWEIDFDAKN
ncbi:MAG: Mur ligase family protein [Proteobacteria bacterium]|nr:Mur ligase family protein [Pseudomonadota bacterium]